ncbi:ABC transporter permease [Promineifilum sp.]|uniref:ABC transporter permease n=1 Tax=Promineifilum sp. TaxID=2664178 RepID=UPI0035ADA4EB
MTTVTEPVGPRPVSLDGGELRELTRLEKTFGPEWARIIKGIITNPLSVAGILLITFFGLVALFAPVLAPKPRPNADPMQIPRDGFRSEPQPPGSVWNKNAPATIPFWYRPVTGNDEWVHLWGTTSGQYDIWYGTIWGTRTAFLASFLVTVSSAIVGIIVGALSGFYGGWIDEILMRVVEIFNAFPFITGALILASLLTPLFGRSIWPATIALIIFGWTGYARQLRGDILATKQRDYVLAARASGAKDSHLMLRHVVPNAVFPTMVIISLNLGSVVLAFAALSFLGIGLPEGYADWGQVTSFARSWILTLDQHWYIMVFPGVALLLYGLGWNLIGDALRDILDPKLRGKKA